MRLQKLAAALVLVIGAALPWTCSVLPAAAQTCADECERQRAERLTACMKISPKNQERCRQNAATEATECHSKCRGGMGRRECEDKCVRTWEKEEDACTKKPDGEERRICRARAKERLGKCFVECEKKWPKPYRR